MGYKSVVRSLAAAARAAERDRKMQERQQIRDYQQNQKLDLLAQSADAAALHADYVDAITSVHRETTTDFIDWETIATAQAPHAVPPAPIRESSHENAAVGRLAAYSPSMADRMLGRAEAKQDKLQLLVQSAAAQDDAIFVEAQQSHQNQLRQRWAAIEEAKLECAFAERVLSGDMYAAKEAIERVQPFSRLGDFGSEVRYDISTVDESAQSAERLRIVVSIRVLGKSVIPKTSINLLASGRISEKALTATRFNEIHQDYVCGCVLRCASETLATLPTSGVIVNAMDEMLNPATGHIEEGPILSVFVPRQTLDRLNLAAVDPSDALSNFLNRMTFRKTTGFSQVNALTWDDVGGTH